MVSLLSPIKSATPWAPGDRFISLWYGHEYSRLWSDFAIVCAFLGGFVGALVLLTKFGGGLVGEQPAMLYRLGSARKQELASPHDEEALAEEKRAPEVAVKGEKGEKSVGWAEKHVLLAVCDLHGANRAWPAVAATQRRVRVRCVRQADCADGRFRGGKTTLLNVLAERVGRVGVVGGQRWVDGQALPRDFQAQMGLDGYRQQMHSAHTRAGNDALMMAEKDASVDECLQMCGTSTAALGLKNLT